MKAAVRVWEMTSPCNCSVCAGRAGIPPETGKPWRRWHEIQAAPEPFVAPVAMLVPAPIPKPNRKPAVVLVGTLDEQIAQILARTDLSNGLKAMQVKNLRKKYESLPAAEK